MFSCCSFHYYSMYYFFVSRSVTSHTLCGIFAKALCSLLLMAELNNSIPRGYLPWLFMKMEGSPGSFAFKISWFCFLFNFRLDISSLALCCTVDSAMLKWTVLELLVVCNTTSAKLSSHSALKSLIVWKKPFLHAFGYEALESILR